MAEVPDKMTWVDLAAFLLKGKKITEVRYMTKEEAAQMGWGRRPVVLELEDGSLFWPSRDDEGNEAGAMFGNTPDGKPVTLPVLR